MDGCNANGATVLRANLSPRSAGGVDADAITFEPCCRLVDEWMTASEPEIARAMIGALEQHNERLEGVAVVVLPPQYSAPCSK